METKKATIIVPTSENPVFQLNTLEEFQGDFETKFIKAVLTLNNPDKTKYYVVAVKHNGNYYLKSLATQKVLGVSSTGFSELTYTAGKQLEIIEYDKNIFKPGLSLEEIKKKLTISDTNTIGQIEQFFRDNENELLLIHKQNKPNCNVCYPIYNPDGTINTVIYIDEKNKYYFKINESIYFRTEDWDVVERDHYYEHVSIIKNIYQKENGLFSDIFFSVEEKHISLYIYSETIHPLLSKTKPTVSIEQKEENICLLSNLQYYYNYLEKMIPKDTQLYKEIKSGMSYEKLKKIHTEFTNKNVQNFQNLLAK